MPIDSAPAAFGKACFIRRRLPDHRGVLPSGGTDRPMGIRSPKQPALLDIFIHDQIICASTAGIASIIRSPEIRVFRLWPDLKFSDIFNISA